MYYEKLEIEHDLYWSLDFLVAQIEDMGQEVDIPFMFSEIEWEEELL